MNDLLKTYNTNFAKQKEGFKRNLNPPLYTPNIGRRLAFSIPNFLELNQFMLLNLFQTNYSTIADFKGPGLASFFSLYSDATGS